MIARMLLFSAAIAAVVLIVLPPFIPPEWQLAIFASFSTVCHQIPERSFHIGETALAVCHRCTGIYAGIPLAMMFVTASRANRVKKEIWVRLFIVALLFMGVDWGLTVIGIWENTMISRTITGLFFGLAAGALLAIVATNRRDKSGTDLIENPSLNFVL